MKDIQQTIEKKRSRSILFRWGRKFLLNHTEYIKSSKGNIQLIPPEQLKAIRSLQIRVYFWAAVIGAVFVLLAILPYHYTSYFKEQTIYILGQEFVVELTYMLYILLLLMPEIWLLNLINMHAIKKMCQILQMPHQGQNDYEEQIAVLTEAGLEMSPQYLKIYDINPYLGMSKFAYYGIYILNKAKAALSNIVAKLIVRRFLGRYALKVMVDLAGVPIYAFWNAFASYWILKEAKVRLISQAAVNNFMSGISEQELLLVQDKIPLLIHFIAQEKRRYNFAIYTYIKGFVERLPELNLHLKKVVRIEEIMDGDDQSNKILGRLLIFGLIVDGQLSVRERLSLYKIKDKEWLPFSVKEIHLMAGNYVAAGRLPQF